MYLLDFLFPKTCLNCGRSGKYICELCIKKVDAPNTVCPECLKPAIDGMTHTKCLRPWGLDGLVSMWCYGGVVRKAILALKYRFAAEIAKELSFYTSQAIRNSSILNRKSLILVPVPLYWYRKNWRGFNQAEEIGKNIAKVLGWGFEPELLIRKRLRVPQTALNRKERLANVQGVFAVSRNIDISVYRDIVLFDDVWTTGSTLKEATKALKKVGAEKVWGLTLAR
jgi:ComF family protein